MAFLKFYCCPKKSGITRDIYVHIFEAHLTYLYILIFKNRLSVKYRLFIVNCQNTNHWVKWEQSCLRKKAGIEKWILNSKKGPAFSVKELKIFSNSKAARSAAELTVMCTKPNVKMGKRMK